MDDCPPGKRPGLRWVQGKHAIEAGQCFGVLVHPPRSSPAGLGRRCLSQRLEDTARNDSGRSSKLCLRGGRSDSKRETVVANRVEVRIIEPSPTRAQVAEAQLGA